MNVTKVLSSKIKVFAVLRAGPEKDQKMSQCWPPARPKTCPERKRKAESEKAGVSTAVQAVVPYVRWPRGGASCCPVRAVAPRWCKLLSGTCAGPAVVQAVVRYVRWTRGGTSCYPVLTGGSTIVRARALRALVFPFRRWDRGGASCSPMLAGGSTMVLPRVLRGFGPREAQLRLAIFQAPRPGEAVPEKQQKSLQNGSPEARKSLQNASRRAPGGQPGAGAHF